MLYLSVEELTLRDREVLPLNGEGKIDTGKIEAALEDASGVIRMHLPYLIDKEGAFVTPSASLAGSLKPIVRDLAIYYLTRITGGEDAHTRYKSAIKLLRELQEDTADEVSSSAAQSIEGQSRFMKERSDGRE